MYIFTDRKIALPLIKAQPLLTGILQTSEPLAWKIIALIEELGEFEEPKDLLQFREITDLEWEEWKEQGIIITVD